MIIPHDTLLIAVVSAALVPADERLLTRSVAPAGTQWKQMCKGCDRLAHWYDGDLLANTHSLQQHREVHCRL